MARMSVTNSGAAGPKYVNVSGSVARDDNGEARSLLRKAEFDGKHMNFQIVGDACGTITGKFQITSFDQATGFVKLESAGDVTRT